MVQDPSATPGSKIGAERQVVIFTRHKLVEYVRNSAPDVMPLQKYIYAHLFEVCSLSAPERHITQVHIYDLGAISRHSLFIGTEEVLFMVQNEHLCSTIAKVTWCKCVLHALH